MEPTIEGKKRIVLLGGTGFIGSHFLRSLPAGVQAVSIARNSPCAPLPGVSYITGDLGDDVLLSEVITPGDVVFHLACSSTPLSSELDGERELDLQVQGATTLLRVLGKNEGAHVIFASSGGTIYGDHGQTPISETQVPAPLSAHGRMKLGVEQAIRQIGDELGVTYTILRPGNVYGRDPDPTRMQGLLEVALARSIAGLSVDVWGDGSVARDYIYIDDVTQLLNMLITKKNPGIFNVGTGTAVSVLEALDILGEVIGTPITTRHRVGRDFDIPHIALDSSKLAQVIGWRSRYNLKDGLRAYYERLLQNS